MPSTPVFYVRTVEPHQMFGLVTLTPDLNDREAETFTIPVSSGKELVEAHHYQSTREVLPPAVLTRITAAALGALPVALALAMKRVN